MKQIKLSTIQALILKIHSGEHFVGNQFNPYIAGTNFMLLQTG
jgi:hypothetical protein